jgi:hypothetical protein
MARIRSIKPEIASDAKLAKLPSDVWRTFLLCISQADDFGLLVGSPRALAGVLYPASEHVDGKVLAKWIDRLVDDGVLERLASADGMPLLHVTNWDKHQPISKQFHSVLSRSLSPDSVANNARVGKDAVEIVSGLIRDAVRRYAELNPEPVRTKSGADPARIVDRGSVDRGAGIVEQGDTATAKSARALFASGRTPRATPAGSAA